MNNTLQKPEDTEYAAMRAWARLVDSGKATVYEAKGEPIPDVSSDMPIPKDIEQAIRWGLVHN